MQFTIKSKLNLKRIFIFFLLFMNYYTGNAKSEIKPQIGHSQEISSIAFSNNGNYVFTGSKDKTVKLYDVKLEKELRIFKGHEARVSVLSVSPDDKFLISGSGVDDHNMSKDLDFSLKLWDIKTGHLLKTFLGHELGITSVIFSKDCKYIISGSLDKTIRVWDIKTGKELKKIVGHKKGILFVSISFDFKFLISYSEDNNLKFWDLKNFKEIDNFFYENINSISFSNDSKLVYIFSKNRVLKTYENNGLKGLKELKEIDLSNDIFEEPIHSQFSNNGKYLGISFSSFISSYDIENKKIINTFGIGDRSLTAISNDGKWLAASYESLDYIGSYLLDIYDLKKNKKKSLVKNFSNWIFSLDLSENEQFLLAGCLDNSVRLVDTGSGKTVKTFIENNEDISYDNLDNAIRQAQFIDSNYFLSSDRSSIKLWSSSSENPVYSLKINNYGFALSENKEYIYLLQTNMQYIYAIDLKTGDIVKEVDVGHAKHISPFDDKNIITSTIQCISIFNMDDGKETELFYGDNLLNIYCVKISADKNYLIFSGTKEINDEDYREEDKTIDIIYLFDIKKRETVQTFLGHKDFIIELAFLDNNKIISGSFDNTIKIWDIQTGKEICCIKEHNNYIRSVVSTLNGKYLYSGGEDSIINLFDLSKYESIYNLFIPIYIEKSSWIIWDNAGYWDASPKGGDLVAMVDGLDCWNIDQFAIKNNRPDKILEKLPNADPELIKHYYSQYQKRLKKLGLTEENLGNDYHVPEVKIIRDEQKERFFDLDIELTDSLYNLKSYNIYINDIPIFGAYGKSFDALRMTPGDKNKYVLSETIELKEEENKIEISCLNEKGAESYRALTYANYIIKEETKHDLYFIGFGVSQYDDPSIKDLNFAHKDVLDLSEVYKGMTERYDNIYTHTFINDQVTPESISKAKDLLKNAKVDDTFVLFISGHGVHDTDPEATYYFLTNNANLDNLAGTAANFELIENLMQGIAPRNKLFLMDTCESGEIDEEQQDIYFAAADSKGITARNVEKRDSKGKTLLKKRAPRPWLFEKDRYIYNDLLRRSGAIVFSSCRGGEFSYESNDIGNGYFTESIIKALSDKDGDKNSDGIVDTDELRSYVTDSVKALSGDLQHPTIDRDNIYAKFGF